MQIWKIIIIIKIIGTIKKLPGWVREWRTSDYKLCPKSQLMGRRNEKWPEPKWLYNMNRCFSTTVPRRTGVTLRYSHVCCGKWSICVPVWSSIWQGNHVSSQLFHTSRWQQQVANCLVLGDKGVSINMKDYKVLFSLYLLDSNSRRYNIIL